MQRVMSPERVGSGTKQGISTGGVGSVPQRSFDDGHEICGVRIQDRGFSARPWSGGSWTRKVSILDSSALASAAIPIDSWVQSAQAEGWTSQPVSDTSHGGGGKKSLARARLAGGHGGTEGGTRAREANSQ